MEPDIQGFDSTINLKSSDRRNRFVSVTTLQAPITAHTAAEYAKEEVLVRQYRGLTAVDRLVSLSDGHIRVPCWPGPRSLQQSPAGSELLRISPESRKQRTGLP